LLGRGDALRERQPQRQVAARAIGQDRFRAGVAVENARLYHELREADRRKNEFLPRRSTLYMKTAGGREVLVLVVSDRDASGMPSTRARCLVCLPGGSA